MDVDVREHGGSRVTLHVRLDKNEVQSAFDRMYQRLSDYGGIRGFRPGKVPRKILDRHYDPEAIRALTYEALIQERVEQVMEQEDLRPIEQVQIEVGAPPDDDELRLAKNALTLSLPRQFETPSLVTRKVAAQQIYELPEDYWETYVDRVEAVTPEEIVEAASVDEEAVGSAQLTNRLAVFQSAQARLQVLRHGFVPPRYSADAPSCARSAFSPSAMVKTVASRSSISTGYSRVIP